MDWLLDILSESSSIQAIIITSLVAALGLQLGKIKILNISLGITFVFFVGIIIGHFKLDINKDMLSIAQNFGLIIFVYALGLQVGPGFFSSLKRGGLKLNLFSFGVIIIGFILTVIFSICADISLTNMVGILSGATTNTPVLGAAQQTTSQILGTENNILSSMASACAVTYPFGVIGVIIIIAIFRLLWGPKQDPNDHNTKNS